ncbi:MAG TPA: enoyl-CoA hydratase-related protein [Candidatus Limnocylindrales bacterium]|nr:enoyl-CoA hydratase-related protein [Candidatus Limnocylindrales bacterium]
MAELDLSRDGDVFVLRMKTGENRFNPDFIGAMNAALDEVEACRGAAALVTTGEGKFYSNGLDLDWLSQQEHADAMRFLATVLALFARIVAFPFPTCAAIGGHAFAGGGMLALAHDWRVMRSDRGFFCLPELDLGMPLVLGMTSLIKEKIGPRAFRETVLTGGRFGADDCVRMGIVDQAAADAEVISSAVERVRPLAGKSRDACKALKKGLYAALLTDLTCTDAVAMPK